jgi:hypothetical protein
LKNPGALAIAALAVSLAALPARPSLAQAGGFDLLSLPDALRENAFAVQVLATLPPATPGAEVWLERTVKYTVAGRPVALKFIGENVIIVVNVTAFDRDASKLFLVTQGQIWVRSSKGSLAYRSTFETAEIAFGEVLHFYPLGLGREGAAPLAIEIAVRRVADLSPEEAGGGPWEEAGGTASQTEKARR